MNKTQVTTLWGIALALGAGVAALKFSQSGESQLTTKLAPGDTLLKDFPAADVSNLKLEGADATVTLAKKDGKWTVTERDAYPARTATVNELIRSLAELKVTRGIEAGPSFAPRFGMDPDAKSANDHGLSATFSDASGKELAKVSLGKNIENNPDAGPMGGGAVGRYVRNHADETGFYATSEMFHSANADASRWLDETFIAPEKITSISITKKDSEEIDWAVTRDTEESEFKLEGAKPDEVLNTTVSTPLKTLLSYARFNDVVNADKVAERSSPNGKRKAVIKTAEGFIYTVQITPAKPAEKKDGDDAASTPQEELLVTVEVSATLPKERKKEEGEKEEDAKSKDEAFKERTKTLTEKLEKEKALAGRTFLVAKTTFDTILKERSEMVTKPEPTPAAGTPASQTSMPGGTVVSPPVQAGGRIQAVTPPIEIPAMPAEDDAAGKSGGE